MENRGGAREGSGRKAIFEIGEAKRTEILEAIDTAVQENKTSVGQELAKMICGKDQRLKMQAIQIYLRDLLPKTSERDVTVTEITKPQVFVPEKYPDSDAAPDYAVPALPDIKTH